MLPVANRNASEGYYRKVLGSHAEEKAKYSFRAGPSQIVLVPGPSGLRLRISIDGFNAGAALTKLKDLASMTRSAKGEWSFSTTSTASASN
jgi:hypothetical protein